MPPKKKATGKTAKRKAPAKPARISLSDQLRQAIAESGVTPYWIANKMGVAPSVLSCFINRKGDIRLESANRIARVLGLEFVKTGPGETGIPK